MGMVTYKLYPKLEKESVDQISSKMRLITLCQSSYTDVTAGWVELRRPGPSLGVPLRCWFPMRNSYWPDVLGICSRYARNCSHYRIFQHEMSSKCPGKNAGLKQGRSNIQGTGRWCFPVGMHHHQSLHLFRGEKVRRAPCHTHQLMSLWRLHVRKKTHCFLFKSFVFHIHF